MCKRSLTVFLIMFMVMTWLGPVQPASAATDTATFTFTSLTNPSFYLVDTTFRITATGTNAEYPPFGYVTFSADGAEITGCTAVYLNYSNASSSPVADTPAECTTNALEIGAHTITAYFHSYLPDIYDDATLTLDGGHTVSYTELAISPDVLPDGQWMLGYSTQFVATGGDGSYFWKVTDKPTGFTLYTDSGEFIGSTGTIGSSTFNITVVDYAGGYGTKDYTLTITQATPNVSSSITNAGTVYADAPADLYFFTNANHPSSNGSITQPNGVISYSVDGVAVSGCSGADALAVENGSTHDYCTFNTAGLTAGEHTLLAEFSPSDEYYTSASGETTFTILPARYDITGMVFFDADMDGVLDSSEGAPDQAFRVNYDIDCDGMADAYVWSENNISGNGEYAINTQTAGSTFCMFLDLRSGDVQTSAFETYTLDGDKYIEIGVYYPNLAFTPAILPDGSVSEYYSQTITIADGTPPYTISDVVTTYLPEGITFDETTLTLSGTATQAYAGFLSFTVTDSTGYNETYSSSVIFQTDGVFTLTSSADPSASGEAVMFTFSGSGEAMMPTYSDTDPVPPAGMVAFTADGETIEGCDQLILNYDWGNNVLGDFPATCTTSALSDGEHVIVASFVDMMSGAFRDVELTLTQVVGVVPDTTPPTITPSIDGTLGADGWYTSDVTLTWTVTDDESASIAQVGCDAVSVTSDQAETSYTCTATSAGGTSSATAVIKRDAAGPVTSITGVEDGAVYAYRRVPAAACVTTDNLSGVAAEAALTLSGGNANGLGEITATCSGALDAAGNAAEAVSVTYNVARPADLSVYVWDSRDPVKARSTLVYTMLVTNWGPYTATGVTVTDTLDPMTTITSIVRPRGWSCGLESNVMTCTTSSLAPGRSAVIMVTTTVSRNARPGNSLVNTAAVSASTYETYPKDNSYTQSTRISR